jgi:hypothetical protein
MKRTPYTLADLKPYDLELLLTASTRPAGTFFCFGMSWQKLFDLNLIDEDTMTTADGYRMNQMYARSKGSL